APAGEFKNPRRDVPFALIVQIVIVTLIYTGVQWVTLGTLPGVVSSQTPLANAAARFLGGWGGLLMTVGGVISILGTNSNTVLSGPRYLYALDANLAQDPSSRRELRAQLQPLLDTLDTGCVGQLAEVFSGDAPHAPEGCVAQAWSVAEVLRALERLG